MVSKKSIVLFLITLLTSTSIWAQTEEIDGVTYDIVTITVNAPSYDDTKPPVFARVKYNKLCPLVITSDDMGGCELNRNWAYFNGYPVFDSKDYGHIPTGMDFLETPYNASALSIQNQTLKRDSHLPLTFSDGTGGIRRFTATSAIWPHHINGSDYTLLTNQDPKVMIRTGWSFAQHDVDNAYTTDAETIAGRFKALSDLWAEITGIGLKVLVEPAGTHKYIDAGKQSDEICWNIFQNGELPNYPEKNPVPISEWTSGTDWTTFGSGKPTATTRRRFFQGDEVAWEDDINSADGTNIILGGTHGIGDDILSFTKELAIGGSSEKADQFWVAGADEVWEYYHLYNNAKITDVSYADGTLTFKVKVPRYEKNQFREMTINIPGITGGTACTFSNNVITGSARQNDGQYTINFGVEDKIKTYISELISYYRSHQHNTYVKDDAQYLIDRLLPGDDKTTYQSQLNAEPTYGTYSVTTSIGGKTLTAGAQDAAAAVTYTFPKYLLSGTDLYQATANGSQPFYVTTFTPNAGTDNRTVNYTKVEGLHEITFFSEGEDLDGAHYNPKSMGNINDSGKGEYMPWHRASNGAGGYINNNEVITVTTVQPGKYNLVVAVGDSYNNATNYATFTFTLGDKTIFSFQTDVQNIKEYTKEAIVVKEPLDLKVTATNSTTSRWIDYLYLEKIAEYDETVPEITLTASSSTIDVTNGNTPVTITATATGYQSTGIAQTVIKDAEDHILASAEGNICQYEYTPTRLGNIVFVGEATDALNRTGISEDFPITVKSNFTLTAQSNFGDELANTTFENQTADKTYRFLYPRYLLKGTNLYETEARSASNSVVHYGEELTFSLANKNIERTVDYNTLTATNIIFYVEGEDVEGVGRWTNAAFDKNQGQSYALTLGSMGTAGGFKSVSQGSTIVTTLPAGQYQLTAIIGSTNAPATYAFKAGDTSIGSYTPTTSTNALGTYTTDPFTLNGETSITISSTQGTSNSQNWVDLIYIQKLDAIPVSVTDAGYATFSSQYALNFPENGTIKAYTASVENNKIRMTKVSGNIPAETGLFLAGTVGTAVEANIPLATSMPDPISGNIMEPHVDAGEVAAGNYVLSGSGTNIAFRKLGSATNVPAGRAYIAGSSITNSVRTIEVTTDDVTGIQLVPTEAATLTAPSYNLKGMPVSERTKGVIIRKGKKYINKR